MADMAHLVATFGDQLVEAKRIGQAQQLRQPAEPAENVVLQGLGGSAFGGEIIRNMGHGILRAPFTIYRGYDVPHYVDQGTLVIASSYSGNTEETLEAAEMARRQGAHIVCISSGGKLKEWATQYDIDFVTLPPGYPPRAAAGLSSVQVLYVLKTHSLLPDFEADLDESIQLLQHFQERAEAEQLARSLQEKALVIYSADSIDSVAIRLRQQINENSKQLCWHHVIPEMNHNELVGWEFPKFILNQAVVVMLRSSHEHPRVSLRFDIVKNILQDKHIQVVDVHAKGSSKLAQLYYHLHYGDVMSMALADANGVDAAPVKVIDFLKNELTKTA